MICPRQIVYSLEALGYLAFQPGNRCINANELASELDIPRHFLGKVMTDLVKKQFVTSAKGPSGGFSLTVNAAHISIYRILAVLGGLEKLEDSCVMGLSRCMKANPCTLHDLWSEFKQGAISKTQKLTLEEFSKTLCTKLAKEKEVFEATATS